ncbi:MAG TPA: nickel ABC transporter permease [Candidatus Dormibacteraeota bacterium]|nr:nickel ABC transporter permease [Candidatus Dormibacteraeota bacterium]
MLRLLARRLTIALPVLLGVTVLVFLILHLIPGDPAQILLFGSNPTPQQIARLRAELGLDQPLPVQYLAYLGRLAHGDLGQSFITNRPVAEEIAQRFPDTLELTLAAMLVAVAIGMPAGIVGGVRPGTWADRLTSGFAVLGVAVPYFWFALILVLVFAVNLRLLPSLGEGSWNSIVLPAVSLGWGLSAIIARLLRNNLVEIYQQPYMQVARAKGLSERAMLYRHALKNALIPVVTILGLQFGNVLSGAVVVEVIFGRPGIGSYLVQAIQAKDIPVVQSVVLFIAVVYILINLAVDLAYGFLDPRIRLSWVRS